MAAVFAWLVGTITGAGRSREDKNDEEEESKKEKDSDKAKVVKGKQKKKAPVREPSFTTTLAGPIEEVIEETLSEETKSPAKSRRKSKQNKNKPIKSSESDYVGFSFFKSKFENLEKEELSNKPSSGSAQPQESSQPHDPIGFSFLPVKDRKSSKKSQKVKVDDLPQSSLIQHYKPKTPVKKTGAVKHSEQSLIGTVNKESGKAIYVEAKESKKVTSKLSYASVAAQRLEESWEEIPAGEIGKSPLKQEDEDNFSFKSQHFSLNEEITIDNSEIVKGEATTVGEVIIEELNNLIKEPEEEIKESEESEEIAKQTLEFLIGESEERSEEESFETAIETSEEFKAESVEKVVVLETTEPVKKITVTESEESKKPSENNEEELDGITEIETTAVNKQVAVDQVSVDHLRDVDTKEEITKQEESGEASSQEFIETEIAAGSKIDQLVDKNQAALKPTVHHSPPHYLEERLKIAASNEESTEKEISEVITEETTQTVIVNHKEFVGSILEEIEETEVVGTSQVDHETIESVNNQIIDNQSHVDCLENSQRLIQAEIAASKGNSKEENTEISQANTETTESINERVAVDQSSLGYLEDNTRTTQEVIKEDSSQEFKTEIAAAITEIVEINQVSQETTATERSKREVSITDIEDSSKPVKMSPGTQIRVLTLNDKEHQDSTLYRIEKDWIVQFRLGPSLLGRKVYLYCNYPRESEEFDRNTYSLLPWSQDEGCHHADDTALLTEITAKVSGSFHYYFTYKDADPKEPQGSGFFLIDPVLKYGKNEDLPLDCIQCQTVLAKSLGPFDTWENKLRVSKESGYNMIHFTPIQGLGVSNSSYSLCEQLKVNPAFAKQNGEVTTFEDIEKLINKMRTEWKIASICDVVLNHTANESHWLHDHPEVTYNCANCPYMRPAYLLDAALHQFSLDILKGLYEDRGIPIEVNSEEHLISIRYHLQTEVLPKVKLHELFICDVTNYMAQFLNSVRNKIPETPSNCESSKTEELKLTQDPFYRRLGSTVDLDLAVKIYNLYRADCFDEETRIKRCAEDFKNKLESLNDQVINEINDHLNAAVENCIAGIKYFRVQHDGPKIKEVSVKNPLVQRYFTDYGFPDNIKEHEETMYSDMGRFLMAHNGWVMNADPLRNFAAFGSNVYIRRELIAWGDSVKLRYGDKPEDCPFLWEHMRAYVEETARIFDGIRLDNCHSTPIPVAEYLLDCARRVRPDLYVVAELFTNSDMTDNIFVNRLGITSLIREAMSAWDSHEQGRLVYRYGGVPVGSFYQPRVRPLVPSVAHALFLDLTHDNPSPIEKRSVFDLLPSSALVNMACCASGSNRGYDELVSHHIHVVDETRQYTEWTSDENLAMGNLRYVTNKSGIIAAKKALNELHFRLGAEGYNQVYVDQMDPDVVAVTRHNPETHESYVLVAFTAFGHPPEDAANYQRDIRPLRVEGVLEEILLEATLYHIGMKSSGSKYKKFENFVKDNKWINGLSEYQVLVKEHIQPSESSFFEKVDSGTPNVFQLNFKNFKPGSVAVVRVSLPEDMREAIRNVRNLIGQFSLTKETELSKIISKLTLPDLNRVLYRCDQEERDEGYGFDTYDIPNFGRTVYAGLQGFMSLLATIRPNNDLGHPMCANLRDGNWMIDYIWKRLKLDEGTGALGQWIEENTKSLKSIPRYLIPCYFDAIVTGLYVLLLEHSHKSMADFVKNGSTFVKALAMGSLQFGAYIKSADLPQLSPGLSDPKPPTRKNEKGEAVQACVTLSAGLPHFSIGYMRNWGRDTFIALRGLFLLTGRYQEARYHILGYAACLRHGLIPNLLDGGRNPRFNCRDAVWWWLHCIKCYVEDAPDGVAILNDVVSRIFPKDDSAPQPAGTVEQPLHAIMQEALTTHFQGLVFRERNAGRQIDEHMSDRGFNNQIGIHPETGFVFGGNSSNCGTWMDKMGSSDKAGNRGKPATPRDGSAVELIGLSKAVITWLDQLSQDGTYPYSDVQRVHKNGSITHWTFKEWANKIQSNFAKYFWVNATPAPNEIRPDLINKRGIYKDCYGASQDWTDFQLRCNFPVSMVVAPELFDPKHAWIALGNVEKHLLGPLGMKTLDPEDWAYNGDYDNSNDSDNCNVAHGFNYHQGPEWLWPVGYFLRAKLHFAAANGQLEKTLSQVKVVLSKHFVELQTSLWRGLPELTNKDGAYCKDSSRTQAWSMSCILEVLYDLQKIEKGHPLNN